MKPVTLFPNASSQIETNRIGVLGIPFDENSSFLKGPQKAPKQIRASYYSDSSNLWTESKLDLGSLNQLFDMGDLNLGEDIDPFSLITGSVENIISKGCKLICLGGDHSITFPIVKAYANMYEKLNILHFDAHPDLYDNLDNNPYSHASPFARIMENQFASRLVQIGIRTLNGHQRDQADKFNVEIHEMKDGPIQPESLLFDAPIYISLDLDCLDPGFAPGVSHYEPGGMSTRDVIHIIQNIKGNVVGADIVEYNPLQDFNNMTSMVAAKFLKEIISRIHTDHSTLL